MTMSAPARRMPVSASSTAARSSSRPWAAAALIMAYSPETLYAATGSSVASRTRRMTSRYGSAGLTMTTSAPSCTSSSASRTAAPVHHVAGRRGVGARLGLGERRAREQLERRVVVDDAVAAQHAAVPMGRVLAQAQVGDDEQVGVLRLD